MSDPFRNSGLCSVFLDHLREINTVHISWIKLGGTPCSQSINIMMHQSMVIWRVDSLIQEDVVCIKIKFGNSCITDVIDI